MNLQHLVILVGKLSKEDRLFILQNDHHDMAGRFAEKGAEEAGKAIKAMKDGKSALAAIHHDAAHSNYHQASVWSNDPVVKKTYETKRDYHAWQHLKITGKTPSVV